MLLIQFASTEAQIQTPRIGVLCVQFADHASNEDARGAVGYDACDSTANPVEGKYKYEHYWNPVFDTTGTITNPDSVSHSGCWGSDSFCFWGSLRQWCMENSAGTHAILPAPAWDSTGRNGLINDVTIPQGGDLKHDGIVVWATLPRSKNDSVYTQSFTYAVGNELGDDCEYLAAQILEDGFDSLDVLIVFYAGQCIRGSSTYVTCTGDSTGIPIVLFCEKADI